MQSNVNVIIGPTSIGKTSLSVDLCKKYDGEVISADSRQIYKEMDIGTGKMPIKKDLSIEKGDGYWILDGVKVWAYDLVYPDQYFSAYDFGFYALTKAKELIEQGKNVFLTGGTGFYVDVFLGKIKLDGAEPNLKLRKELEKLSLEDLSIRLTSLNPEAPSSIDMNNPVRIIRAIEKLESTNSLSPSPLPYIQNLNYKIVGLTSDRDFLYAKSDAWVEYIWNNGLLDETSRLISLGFTNSRPMHGLIYKTAADFLDGMLDRDKAIQRTKYDIHAYIRRQQTYFKKMEDVEWFDIHDGELTLEIEKKLLKS